MRKHIPNMLTCLNLLSGAFGVYLLLTAGNDSVSASALTRCFNQSGVEVRQIVLLCVCCSAIFDFLDGFVARLLKVSSPVGKELDSLADLVSFGMLPTTLAFTMVSANLAATDLSLSVKVAVECVVWLMLAFSALRLAKFNVDTRQTSSFLGMATPANALFWIGLFYGGFYSVLPWWALLVMVLVCCCLLVSELPMFSFKIHSLRWSEAKFQILLLMGSLGLILEFGFAGLSLAIVWYVFLSVLKVLLERSK